MYCPVPIFRVALEIFVDIYISWKSSENAACDTYNVIIGDLMATKDIRLYM